MIPRTVLLSLLGDVERRAAEGVFAIVLAYTPDEESVGAYRAPEKFTDVLSFLWSLDPSLGRRSTIRYVNEVHIEVDHNKRLQFTRDVAWRGLESALSHAAAPELATWIRCQTSGTASSERG